MVCNGVETEPVLQDITGEELNRGANTALGKAEVGFLRRKNLPPKCRFVQGYGSKPDL